LGVKPEIIVLLDRSPDEIAQFERSYTVYHAPDPASRAAVFPERGAGVRAVATSGTLGLTADEISAAPNLEIICCVGAGYDGVDTAVARQNGIAVTHGPNTNNSTVGDHAFALLLSLGRGVAQTNDAVKRGVSWAKLRQDRPLILGKRLGILGLGKVGMEIARRSRGFEMPISYHNRSPRSDVDFDYKGSVLELARDCDFLVVSLPGDASTRHVINDTVLDALGPSGFLINIGRGSLVDTQALMAAVREGRIAGAAVDVIEGEPAIPDGLADIPNLIITPHIGWLSPEARQITVDLILENLAAHFAGLPLVTPIPEHRA